MLICYLCDNQINNRKNYIKHIRKHESNGLKLWPAICKQPNCTANNEFYSLDGLRDHLRDKHGDDNDENAIQGDNPSKKFRGTDEDYSQFNFDRRTNENIEEPFFFDSNSLLKKLQDKIFFEILTLKSKANLSESSLILIIKIFSGIYETVFEEIINNLNSLTKNWGDRYNEMQSFLESLNIIRNPFSFVDSIYKQMKLIDNTNCYIKPTEYVLGLRAEDKYVDGKMKLIYKNETFQYISITDSLSLILKNKQVINSIDGFEINSPIKPALFAVSPFWSNKKTLRLILYYDDIEIKNPLGESNGVYKLGMFYFSIYNLTRKHNSNLKNIFVISACYSEDLKKYGMNTILELIKNEIIILETKGLEINGETYFASISQVVADNLALHQLFSLKANFIGDNICHLCDANRDSIQINFNESLFKKKTQDIYNKNLTDNSDTFKEHGYKTNCVLNELKYFHTTKNYMFDITHDFWEGIVPLELSLILKVFISEKKYFNLNFLNERIKSFEYGPVEGINKPSPLKLDGSDIKVKQKAAKISCLFRMLPFLIADKIPDDDEHWELYLILSQIIDICISTYITLSHIGQLEWLIEAHHSKFKELFPNTTLKKKHHNMVHYPSSLLYLSNLVDYITLRFEAKHVFVKTAAITTHNCINLPYSVLKKHQIYNCSNIWGNNLLNSELDIEKYDEIEFQYANNDLKDLLIKRLNYNSNTIILDAVIKVFGQTFKKNFYVLYTNKENKTQFGLINDVIIIKNKSFFFIRELECEKFDKHYHSYIITEKDTFDLLEISNLFHYHPLNKNINLDNNDNRAFIRTLCIVP